MPRAIRIRELKQLRRQGQRKHHLELEFALFQTSSLQFYLVQFVKYARIFLELILNDFIQIRNRKKEIVVSCLRTS